MEDYQERVLIEQKELSEKIVKLTTFITDWKKAELLDCYAFDLLNRQLESMTDYHRILIMRLRPNPMEINCVACKDSICEDFEDSIS